MFLLAYSIPFPHMKWHAPFWHAFSPAGKGGTFRQQLFNSAAFVEPVYKESYMTAKRLFTTQKIAGPAVVVACTGYMAKDTTPEERVGDCRFFSRLKPQHNIKQHNFVAKNISNSSGYVRLSTARQGTQKGSHYPAHKNKCTLCN